MEFTSEFTRIYWFMPSNIVLITCKTISKHLKIKFQCGVNGKKTIHRKIFRSADTQFNEEKKKSQITYKTSK